MKKIKRIFFLFLFLILIVTISPVAAQAPNVNGNLNTNSQTLKNTEQIYSNNNPNVEKNLHTLSQNVLIETLSSIACLLSGKDPLNPTNGKCLGIDPITRKIGYVGNQEGIAQTMGSLIGGTFSIPVSGTGYVQYAMDNFGIAKKAQAQEYKKTGLGYDRLTPLIGIWTRFRDIAYLGFVLAFTIVGLAIMLRVRIDARTVMTIQNQIPKIVIALVLVTFSYAIAGFLIDLMYVAIFVVILAFSNLTTVNINPNANVFTVVNQAFSVGYNVKGVEGHVPGIIGLAGKMSWSVSQVFGNLAINFLESTISSLFKALFSPLQAVSAIGCGVIDFAASGGLSLFGYIPVLNSILKSIPGIGGLFSGSAGCDFLETMFRGIIFSLFSVITFIVILVAIIFSLFRVWFSLIKSFAYILVDVIVGPIWIAAGIFPGAKLNFSTWIKHLIAHLSVFPVTFAAILLGKTIIDNVSGSSGLFSPPLIGSDIGGSSAVAAFIGFAFILSLPGILERTRKAVGALELGLGEIKRSFGAGRAVGGVGVNAAFGTYTEAGKEGLTPVRGPKKLLHAMGILH